MPGKPKPTNPGGNERPAEQPTKVREPSPVRPPDEPTPRRAPQKTGAEEDDMDVIGG